MVSLPINLTKKEKVMKNLNNLLFLGIFLCLSGHVNANIELNKKSVHVPSGSERIRVTHDGENFHVINHESGKQTKIESYFVDANIRNVSTEQLLQFLDCDGYLELKKLDSPEDKENETFTLKANTRGLGGGPVAWAAWLWGGVPATIAAGAAAGTAVGGPVGTVVGGAVGGIVAVGISIGAAVAPTP